MNNLELTISGVPAALHLDKMISGFIEALYFADCGEDDQPSYDAEISNEARTKIQIECLYFYHKHNIYCEAVIRDKMHDELEFYHQAGIDLYLTGAGHGAGFWDKSEWYDIYTDMFTNYCDGLNYEIYAGDDQEIYFS